MRRPAADTKLSSSRKTGKRCSGNGGNAVAGAAVRVAVGSVCRQHVRDVARVRAFALIAIIVLHAGPTAVSALAAAGRVVGAAVAVPLAPWVEFRQKRPVMVAMDLVRFAAVITVPAAFACGWLSFAQLLIVSIIVAAADIAFRAASGAYLKTLVRPEDLLVANGRFESTTWTATALGPPLGGAAISIFGPVTTMVLDAVSYLCSVLGIGAIRGREPPPALADTPRLRVGDLFEGWRYILSHRTLRLLFFNTALVNGLIMATSPLIAVLMLGQLGFKPWQYGLAFGLPCIGGLIGSRLARTLVARFGQHKVMFTAGALRACWSVGLAFIHPGIPGSRSSSPFSLAWSPRPTESPAHCRRGRSPATSPLPP